VKPIRDYTVHYKNICKLIAKYFSKACCCGYHIPYANVWHQWDVYIDILLSWQCGGDTGVEILDEYMHDVVVKEY